MMTPIGSTVRLPSSVKPKVDPFDRGGRIGADNPVASAGDGLNRALGPVTQSLGGLTSALSLVPGPIGLVATGFNVITGAVKKVATAIPDFVESMAKAGAALSAVSAKFLQIPTQALDQFITSIQSNIAKFVQSASPGVFNRFRLAVDDLNASIGRHLIPVLEQFTSVVRSIGGAIFGLQGPASKLIQGMAAAVPIFVALGAAFAGVVAIMSGGIVPALAGVTAGLVGMQAASGGLKPLADKFASIFAGVMDHIGAAAVRIQGVVQPIIDVFAEFGEGIAGTISDIADAIKESGPAFDDLKMVFSEIKDALAPLVREFHSFGTSLITQTIRDLAGVFREATPYIVAFTRIMGELVRDLVSWVNGLLGLPSTLPRVETPRGEVPGNVGAAARSVSTGSVDDVLRKARESAFQLGTGSDPAKETAKNTTDINQSIKNQQKALEAMASVITNIPADIERNVMAAADAVVVGVGNAVKGIATTLASNLPGVGGFSKAVEGAAGLVGSGASFTGDIEKVIDNQINTIRGLFQ